MSSNYDKLLEACENCTNDRDCNDCPINETIKYYEEEES